MYTPMKWDETGSKDVNFNFGGEEFQADIDFDSILTGDTWHFYLLMGLESVWLP